MPISLPGFDLSDILQQSHAPLELNWIIPIISCTAQILFFNTKPVNERCYKNYILYYYTIKKKPSRTSSTYRIISHTYHGNKCYEERSISADKKCHTSEQQRRKQFIMTWINFKQATVVWQKDKDYRHQMEIGIFQNDHIRNPLSTQYDKEQYISCGGALMYSVPGWKRRH